MNIVDLHVHSNKSDGSYSPSQLVDYALEKGLTAFALTDHDTVNGIKEAMDAAISKPIEVIPGIELSTEYLGRDIHILGLDIDYQKESFQTQLLAFQNSRLVRNEKMCQKLTQHGIPVSFSKLQMLFPESVITRAHYAKFLVQRGHVKSIKEAFDRYIGDYAPCFVAREKVTPVQGISLILQAGGIPILAHPLLYRLGDRELASLVSLLAEHGLIALEAVYATYSPSDERRMRALAKQFHLKISGGSDFHGTTKPGLDLATGYGKLVIPEDILLTLRKESYYDSQTIIY